MAGRRGLLAAALLLPLVGSQVVRASDHDEARAAMMAGQIRPLAELLADVERRFDGRVIETELEREDGRWVYKFKLLPPTGHVFEVQIDAANGTLTRTSGPVRERPPQDRR